MSNLLYYFCCGILAVGILIGIYLMSKVEKAAAGNLLSALCTAFAVILTLYKYEIISQIYLWIIIAIGLIAGLFWAKKIKMIEMPQVVALLNGFGGAASAIVAYIMLAGGSELTVFSRATAGLALAIGMLTLTGSLVAAGKLHKVLAQKPVVWQAHQTITTASLAVTVVAVILICFSGVEAMLPTLLCIIFSAFFGFAFAIRVGGADMPITISLLNSLSGVAGAIAGMAVGDPLLVAVGGIVGASGLFLTKIMCRAMNRSLADILLGKTSAHVTAVPVGVPVGVPVTVGAAVTLGGGADAVNEPVFDIKEESDDPVQVLKDAKKVIFIPGYGMALAQAQSLVKELFDKLEMMGKDVKFAIHPVAGRMPGHMNVLLCEVDVPYEKLYEMEVINPEFEKCDAVIIIGANDVVNAAARSAEGTPIYGMPVLRAEEAKHVIVCNYDLKPGYAGVENPLYTKSFGVTLLLGDAKDTLKTLIDGI